MRIPIMAIAAPLSGCNANQQVSPSSPTASQVFAGRYAETNPYNPISRTTPGAAGAAKRRYRHRPTACNS